MNKDALYMTNHCLRWEYL